MYEGINSKNYDFLWSVGNVHYLFDSFWLHAGFLKRDFVLTSKYEFHTFYISKEERKRASKEGLELYYKKFDSYGKKVKKQFKISEKVFKELKNKDFSKMSNLELADHFQKTVEYFQKIWGQYYWTEYFCTDKIADIIKNNGKSYNLTLLKRNVDKMADLKYKQRKLLNDTFYPTGPMENYYKVIGSRFSLPTKITNYHWEELIELLKGKKIEIPDRSIFVKGKFSDGKDILGKEAERIIKQLEEYDPTTKIIKGNTGNKGYYKGVVKKIDFDLKTNFIKEINKMNRGDVLVSGSTGPEMILACKKAGAIITDEGGITSHAALVSRELDIPSVIATKIATKVLKDGDLVEVDANKGIVRIIKKGLSRLYLSNPLNNVNMIS